ncbi:ABC transporter permease [Halobellus inordinatus]|uniref:ABC transporter permease n=1 Tax=Halobellus inordinatus TaxID=1126236 RepID=UPI00210E1C98|nr:ABC transporter permease [Halobellus inordinatus]
MASESVPESASKSYTAGLKEQLMENRRVRFLVSPGSGLFWILLFLIAPLTIIVAFSFFKPGEAGSIVYELTLANYREFVSSSVYHTVIWDSIKIGIITTLIVLPLGYTLGYFLGRTESRWTPVLLGLVVVQFWVPLIIRTYAWITVLGRNGVINKFLTAIGVIGEPVQLLYTTNGMILGLVVSILPFMVLPVYSAVSTIEEDVIQAAKTLGASDARAFFEVTLPLSWPGVVSGILFTFILSAGSFVAPALLGGPEDRLIAPVIATIFTNDFNWPFAAALSLVYILFLAVLLYLFTRKADLEEALEGTQI